MQNKRNAASEALNFWSFKAKKHLAALYYTFSFIYVINDFILYIYYWAWNKNDFLKIIIMFTKVGFI